MVSNKTEREKRNRKYAKSLRERETMRRANEYFKATHKRD